MKQSRITFLTSLGSGLEYYDFVIYVIFAGFISQNYFPATNRVSSLFATFGVFAIGNIIRPLGGVFFGVLGDKFGRKKIFSITLIWMGLATFLMGFTPSFSAIGLAATIIFSLCRIVQGITCGAEIPGAATFLFEHTPKKHLGLHFGFMSSSVGLGSSLALFIAWILTKIIGDKQMFTWGFRLPFIFGGILAFIGVLIRQQVTETPAFLATKETKDKFISGIDKSNIRQVINAIGLLIFPASFVTLFLAFPVYLHDSYHYNFPDIYLAMTIGSIWTSFLIPVFGWASDYFINRKTLLLIAVIIFALSSFPVFSLLYTKTTWALFVFVLFGKTIIAAMAASYFVILPSAFPTRVRYTGTAVSYNIAYSIAALLPIAINYIYGVLKNPDYIVYLLILLATLTVISTLMLQRKQQYQR